MAQAVLTSSTRRARLVRALPQPWRPSFPTLGDCGGPGAPPSRPIMQLSGNHPVRLSSLMGAGLFALAIMGYVGVGGTEQIAKAKPAETTATTDEPWRSTPTPLPPAEFIVPVVDRR